MSNKKYMNVKEVSAHYGFAVKTLYKWASEKKIPHFRPNGVLLFSPEKLDAWMERKEVKTKAIA